MRVGESGCRAHRAAVAVGGDQQARADAALEAALAENAPWTDALGAQPNDRRRAATWRKSARVVAAYRDRYRITDDAPLGAPPE